MSEENRSLKNGEESGIYEIRIKGQIDVQRAKCFDGMTITLDGNDSLLTGPVADQAALHGLLKKTRDSGISLVSVKRIGESKMKAAVYHKYGSPEVVEVMEIPRPVPKSNEVLIKIHATTVSSADWRIRSLSVPAGFGPLVRLAFGICKPRKPILGTELAGEIVTVGKNVTRFSVGDRVFAHPGARFGCHAQYIALPEHGPVALKPDSLSYEEAAALSFGGVTALYFLRDRGGIQRGEKVLINGASGTVGSAAIQLAKYFGAEVTAICSTANLELVKSVGADKVIDYTREDFTRNGESYDIIMDAVGTAPWSRVKTSLTDTGRLLLVVAGFFDTLLAPLVSSKGGKKALAGTAKERSEDLDFLAHLAATEKFKPVIDRSYPLEQIAEAHTLVDTGHKRGSVVIKVGHDDYDAAAPSHKIQTVQAGE